MTNKATSREKFDEVRHSFDLTTAYLKNSHEELDSYMRCVADREADLNVYENVRNALNTNAGDRCLVFIGDNYFVERTIASGKQMLDRIILQKKNFLRALKSDVTAIEKRIQCVKCVHMDGNGQVEIHEKFEGPSNKNTKRIAHISKWGKGTTTASSKVAKAEPLVSSENKKTKYKVGREGVAVGESKTCVEPARNAGQDVDYVSKLLETKPKGISDKDFLNFMKIVDELVSDDDEDEDDDYKSEDEYSGNRSEVTSDSETRTVGKDTLKSDIDERKEEKHVHFSDRLCEFRRDPCNEGGDIVVVSGVDENVAGPAMSLARQQNEFSPNVKPILRNKGEVSPINESWMRKIKMKEEPKRREVISEKLFSDIVVERNIDTFEATLPGTSKGKQSPRTMSEFKKMQLAKRKK